MNDSTHSIPSFRTAASSWLRFGIEGIVLLLVTLSPWFYGSVDPFFESALLAGVGAVAVLWGLRAALDGQFVWFACPISLCLGLMFFLGVVQLVPVPSWVLAVLSPQAAALNAELRPAQPEVIAAGEPPASHPGLPTVSLYPTATRQMLCRLLAVVVLFAAVRVNVASTEALKRLAWVAVVNGVLLALFGMVQFVQSQQSVAQPKRTVFGFETRGDVFGPFICRNHFAYYANLCIGLGVGLMLASGRSEGEKRARRTHKAQALVEQTAEDEPTLSFLNILHTPMQLWLTVGIAIMVVGVICSLSRGGVAALVAGVLTAMVLRGFGGLRVARLQLLVVPALLAAGLIAWLGIKPLESRLALTGSDLSADGRLTIWKNLLPAAAQFPVLGSGFGTLQFIEPLYRRRDYTGYNADVDIDHAHNDYLEALVEGGLPRLALTVAVVVLLFNYGHKAMRRHEVRTPGRLAFGALVGVAAVAAHSFVDFGLFTPAVACIAAVVAANLCNMARSDPSEPPTERSKHSVVVGLGGWGGLAALVGLAVIAAVLVRFGQVNVAVHQARMAAFRALRVKPPNPDVAIASLTAAVRANPDDAQVRVELGQAALDTRQLRSRSTNVPPPAELFSQFVKPALQQLIAARDLCPLLPRPQARLAAYAYDARPEGGIVMARSDPSTKYWERAVRLAPYDADLLYQAGKWQLESGNVEAAWDLWRRSLERRPTHRKAIIAAAAGRLGPEGLLSKVLPGDPGLWLEAARYFGDRPDQADAQRQLVLKAKQQLLERASELDAASTLLLARSHRMLGESDLARSAYRQAVLLAPNQAEWHYEFAEFLYSIGNDPAKREAVAELNETLRVVPNSTPARNLLAAIEAELKR